MCSHPKMTSAMSSRSKRGRLLFQQLVLSALLVVGRIQRSWGLPKTISGDALRRVEGTPGLGRGYSVTTNTMMGACLNVTQNATEYSNSYTFDYYFTDFTRNDVRSPLGGKIQKTFGFPSVKASVMRDRNQPTHTLVVTMRLERYFSSVWESAAPINQDAKQMIQDEEFVNFFMACGPNYVRSFQRAQEVTAIFNFESDDSDLVQKFANVVRLYVKGNREVTTQINDSGEFTEILSTLSIDIMGFGLGLNNAGAESLTSVAFDEFNEVMKFAFDSMTKNQSTDNTDAVMSGVISKMEVLPWADNAEFLQLADVDFNSIFTTISHHLLPDGKQTIGADGDPVLTCDNILQNVDSYGKCCEPFEMVKLSGDLEFCKPQEYLPPITLKENLETNAEFVVWLNSVAHQKANRIQTLTQCVNKLRSFPPRHDYEFLEQSEVAIFDEAIDMQYTRKELQSYLDPSGDQSILLFLTYELNEYMEMFYSPCLSSLYGRRMKQDNEIDPRYFMAKPWYDHPDCAMPSCLESDKAWNRKTGKGCVDGIVKMTALDDDELIPGDNDPFCSKNSTISSNPLERECEYKYPLDYLVGIHQCRESLPKGRDGKGSPINLSIAYVMDYFCNPQLSGIVADGAKISEVDTTVGICLNGE